MTPSMIGFLCGMVVGGFGATFLIGLLFLDREPEEEIDIQEICDGLSGASIAKSKIGEVTVCRGNSEHGESLPQDLPELDLNLSTYPAPIDQSQ